MDESRKNIFDHLSILYYRKWLFIVPIVIGILAGAAISYRLPEYYSSSTLLIVEDQQIPEEYVTPADRTPFTQRLNAITQQIMSRTKLREIINEYELYSTGDESFLSRLSSIVRFNRDEASSINAIERMREDIKFEVLGEPQQKKFGSGGNAFTITYSGTDPEKTMQVTNTLASLFVQENLRTREQHAEGTSEFLTNELAKSKTELEGIEKKIKAFKEKHMGSLPEQLETSLRTLDRLQVELQNVRASLNSADNRRVYLADQISTAPVTARTAAGNPLIGEIEELQGQLSSLRSVYKDSYPDVIIMKRRIGDLEAKLREQAIPAGTAVTMTPEAAIGRLKNPVLTSELSNVKSQITNLRRREQALKAQIADYEKRIEQTPRNEQRQTDLMRDYEMSLANYQNLLEKKMSAKLAENVEKNQKGASFKVVDPANRPITPSWPNKMMVMLFGFIGGGSVGTGLVFLSEIMNPAFRKPEDFEGVFAQPVLTSIPVFPYSAKKQSRKLTVIKGRK